MPRVLIATDEPNFTMGLVDGYRALGWDVATGSNNFRIRTAEYDVVHHQWPEEFCNWGAPSSRELEQIKALLCWWQNRATNIFTVNNLYPHQFDKNQACHELYSLFFSHCQLITHFTKASHRLVLQEYSAARLAKNIVHSPGNYSPTLQRQLRRGSRRSDMGISEDAFTILMLGSMRSWGEFKLMQKAYDFARIPKKRLLMAGKIKFKGSVLEKRLKMLLVRFWLKRIKAFVDSTYVPEEEVSQFLDSCNVAIVPRLGGLNSAIIFAAMTFGRAIVAPDLDGYSDCLSGTRNLLYKVGDAQQFASKLEEAAALDLDEIGRENAEIASKWTWKEKCEAILAAANVKSFV